MLEGVGNGSEGKGGNAEQTERKGQIDSCPPLFDRFGWQKVLKYSERNGYDAQCELLLVTEIYLGSGYTIDRSKHP